MQFYRLDEIPVSPDDQVFKKSLVGNGIATLIFFGIAIASLVTAIQGGKPLGITPGVFYFLAVVFGLIGLLPLGMFRASLRPSNWLVRCSLGGIIIKYRPYENWRLPADTLQAVGFEYGEIAWAKLVKEQRKSPSEDGKGGSQTAWLTYIDLGLANGDATDLENHLQAERNLRPNGMLITLDFPVQTLPGGIVEVRWNGTTPSAQQALLRLGQRVKIVDPEQRKTDLTHHRGINTEDEKAKILALAKSGDEMGATKLARQAYGYSLTEATEYVDKLLGRADD